MTIFTSFFQIPKFNCFLRTSTSFLALPCNIGRMPPMQLKFHGLLRIPRKLGRESERLLPVSASPSTIKLIFINAYVMWYVMVGLLRKATITVFPQRCKHVDFDHFCLVKNLVFLPSYTVKKRISFLPCKFEKHQLKHVLYDP